MDPRRPHRLDPDLGRRVAERLTARPDIDPRPPRRTAAVTDTALHYVVWYYHPDDPKPISEITAEVASTPRKRAVGLSGHEALHPQGGMLFLTPHGPAEREETYHVGGVKFPFDIVFVRRDHKIGQIVHNIQPEDPGCWSYPRTACVIEVVGGYCKAHGIKVGDEVGFGHAVKTAQTPDEGRWDEPTCQQCGKDLPEEEPPVGSPQHSGFCSQECQTAYQQEHFGSRRAQAVCWDCGGGGELTTCAECGGKVCSNCSGTHASHHASPGQLPPAMARRAQSEFYTQEYADPYEERITHHPGTPCDVCDSPSTWQFRWSEGGQSVLCDTCAAEYADYDGTLERLSRKRAQMNMAPVQDVPSAEPDDGGGEAGSGESWDEKEGVSQSHDLLRTITEAARKAQWEEKRKWKVPCRWTFLDGKKGGGVIVAYGATAEDAKADALQTVDLQGLLDGRVSSDPYPG